MIYQSNFPMWQHIWKITYMNRPRRVVAFAIFPTLITKLYWFELFANKLWSSFFVDSKSGVCVRVATEKWLPERSTGDMLFSTQLASSVNMSCLLISTFYECTERVTWVLSKMRTIRMDKYLMPEHRQYDPSKYLYYYYTQRALCALPQLDGLCTFSKYS